jgi:hypothetical protein
MQVKLYSAATTVGIVSALIAYQVPKKCKLIAVVWSAALSTATSPSNAAFELSRSSASQITTNDPQGVISGMTAAMGAAGAGNIINTNFLHIGMNESFEAGDRIYVHRYFGLAGAAEPAIYVFLTFA